MPANVERDHLLIEEAVANIEHLNATMARVALNLFNPETTNGDAPEAPSEWDRKFCHPSISETRHRRDQLEERLLRRILPS